MDSLTDQSISAAIEDVFIAQTLSYLKSTGLI